MRGREEVQGRKNQIAQSQKYTLLSRLEQIDLLGERLHGMSRVCLTVLAMLRAKHGDHWQEISLRFKLSSLRARLRGHRVKTARLALPLRPIEHWLKVKNPAAPAVKREAEEDRL
jgi:hypothetical protein